MADYKKPGIEVYQEFVTPSTTMTPAELPSVLVGPMYQIFKDAILGTYDNTESIYYLPSDLLSTSNIEKDSIKVVISNYAETHEVSEIVVKVDSATGVSTSASDIFTDGARDFIAANVIPHSTVDSNDGDYLHIPAGANAGYYKILEIIDSHNIKLDRNLSANVPEESYVIQTIGYTLDETDATVRTLKLTPELGYSGNVLISFKAIRTDMVGQLYYWDSLTAIENAVGYKGISDDNPLPYAASLIINLIGNNGFIMAAPTSGNELSDYQKAFDMLKQKEVHTIVPLTQNKAVHLALKDHVLTMSEPANKRERIGLINSAWMTELVKVGFFSAADGMTGPIGLTLTGELELGDSIYDGNDVVIFETENIPCDNTEHTYTINNPQELNRVVVNYGLTGDNIAAGTAISYELNSNPGTYVAVTADTDPYHCVIMAPANDKILSVKVTSSINDSTKSFVLGVYNTADQLAYTEYNVLTAAAQTVPQDPRTDVITLTATDITNKQVALSGVPIDNDLVRVHVDGLQAFINGVDYVIVVNGGVAYVNWANRPMESSVEQGQVLKASYQAALKTIKTIIPTAGHKALKIRRFDVTQQPSDPLLPVRLPEGMSLYVVTANHQYTLTYAGSYNFPEDIVEIYAVVSTTEPISNDNVFVNIDVAIMTAAGTYQRNRFIDLDGSFLTTAKVVAGDILRIKNGSSAGEYEILTVKSDKELIVDALWRTFESNLEYEVIKRDLTSYERANMYKDYSLGFNTRRITHVFAPYVGVPTADNTIKVLPGYYGAVIIAAYCQALSPQAGMTNMVLSGISRVLFTDDTFTGEELDIIASGGTLILSQEDEWSQPYIRHQITTAASQKILEKSELSCVRILDYLAKHARKTLKPYIGPYNVNEKTLHVLYGVANGLTSTWEKDDMVLSANLVYINILKESRDSVEVCIIPEVMVPLNHIKLIFQI